MPEQIGKYHVVERIGRGGMGMIFKAHDPVLDRLVALKVISPEVEVTDELRARFFREAQACAKLNHPNIVTVHDMGEDDGRLFIVMELLEGDELRRLIAQGAPLSLEDKLAIMLQVCSGLHYAHQKGIVHRDMKPGNVFMLRNGQVKIVDFGIAHIAASESGLTRTGLIMGTLRYISPEQLRGRADHRSDQFSVGAVLYELLTSRPPFVADDAMQLLEKLRTEEPPPPTQFDPTIPPRLTAIVERAMRKDPAERFHDLEEMRAELEVVHGGLVAERHQVIARVRRQRERIAELRSALAERGEVTDHGESLPAITDRSPVGTAEAAERELAAVVEALEARLARVDEVRVARQSAQRAQEQMGSARAEAQAANAARHAAGLWSDAERAWAAALADLGRDAYAEATQKFGAAAATYRRALDAARQAQADERRAAEATREARHLADQPTVIAGRQDAVGRQAAPIVTSPPPATTSRGPWRPSARTLSLAIGAIAIIGAVAYWRSQPTPPPPAQPVALPSPSPPAPAVAPSPQTPAPPKAVAPSLQPPAPVRAETDRAAADKAEADRAAAARAAADKAARDKAIADRVAAQKAAAERAAAAKGASDKAAADKLAAEKAAAERAAADKAAAERTAADKLAADKAAAERAAADKAAPERAAAEKAAADKAAADKAAAERAAAARRETDVAAVPPSQSLGRFMPDASGAIRQVLDEFKRAYEAKDLAMVQRIRPGLRADDLQTLRSTFDNAARYTLNLRVDTIEVRGDEAQAHALRQDVMVAKDGQIYRSEARVTVRLKRAQDRWTIDDIR